jgi:hypothetical protein
MFRKASSATVIANLSKHQIFFKLFICFFHKILTPINQKKSILYHMHKCKKNKTIIIKIGHWLQSSLKQSIGGWAIFLHINWFLKGVNYLFVFGIFLLGIYRDARLCSDEQC